MSNPSFLQQSILVDVSYYDSAEKKKLESYDTRTEIRQVTEAPIAISIAEFLIYFLFYKKGRGVVALGSYTEIQKNLDIATTAIKYFIDYNGESICTARGVTKPDKHISEHIGESIGLSVISRIHGLTEADWNPIPQEGGRRSKRFDFQIASDGQRVVQVENKGSSVADNRKQPKVIKNHYANIVEKKRELRALPSGMDPYPASLRYGTITAIDPRRFGRVKCWLADPDPDDVEGQPKNMQLLSRMRFIRNWVGLISPRSQLAAALSTRCADLEEMLNPYELDGVPLRRGNNEVFPYRQALESGEESGFFSSKSRVVSEMPAGGAILRSYENNALILLGIQDKLIAVVATQKFDEITGFQAKSAILDQEVDCQLTKSQFDRLGLREFAGLADRQFGGYVAFKLSGLIHYSRGGLVLGFLPLPEQESAF